MIEAGLASANDFAAVDAEIKAVVDEAVQFATNSPFPDPATVDAHIYSDRIIDHA